MIIYHQERCEGLRFQDQTGRTTDLLHTDHVELLPCSGNVTISLGGFAVELMQKGGRVQFVNEFR